jgi:AraC-like DNA-binding protein
VVGALVAQAFAELRISGALWHPPADWNVIHREPNVIAFETEHGQEQLRRPYNEGSFKEVLKTRALVRGKHAGYSDLFVPVLDGSDVCAILVVGPYLTKRPTGAEIVERWISLTRSQPQFGTAGFSQYVSATLATLTLEGALGPAFERLLGCFAAILGQRGSPRALMEEARALREQLGQARSAERMWEAVSSMLDERTARSWGAVDQSQPRWEAGLRRVAGPVTVGLVVDGTTQADALEGFLRRDAFQRRAVTFARETEGIACGRIGDHGVVLLSDARGSATRLSAHLNELANDLRALSRRFGLALYLGIALPKDAEHLPERYLVALAAAEKALSQGTSVVFAEHRLEHSAKYLRKLRQQLATGLGNPQALSARFEHYTQTVLQHCGYRLDPVYAKLEAGLERLSEPLLGSGLLDEKSFDEISAGLERSLARDITVAALVERYREAMSDIESAIATPAAARRGHSMRRALKFMREHLGEPLSLAGVARIAGFAPNRFSKLFKQTYKTTYERYLLRLRVDYAKQVLCTTSIGVEAVGGLCGFKNRIHFHHAFKRLVGLTPMEHRRQNYHFSGDEGR